MRLQIMIAWILRAGVIVSSVVTAIGLVSYLLTSRAAPVAYGVFTPVEPTLHATLPLTLMWIGLLLLIATPVARVAMCVVVFLVERDYLYTTLTLVVFAVLLYGLLLDKG